MRRKPYTEIGLSRVPCLRCGHPSAQQWQICSLGSKWSGVCTKCDVELNTLVLKYMRIKNWREIIKRYSGKRER